MDQILAAFDKMDHNKSGRISTADIRSHYNARNHPDYKNGDLTEKELADQVICDNTLIMVYKGCMILKTRGIPNYFQNFGSFYPLLFFQMIEKSLNFLQNLP